MSNLDEYSKFIASSRYARWLDEEGRRETWPETVQRYIDYWGDTLTAKEAEELRASIEQCDVMPSMRRYNSFMKGAALQIG